MWECMKFVVSFTFTCLVGIMEDSALFSLEDDDANELFITQTPRESLLDQLELTQSDGNNSILGVCGSDFQSPCTSLVTLQQAPMYEDISDDEFIPQGNSEVPNFE